MMNSLLVMGINLSTLFLFNDIIASKICNIGMIMVVQASFPQLIDQELVLQHGRDRTMVPRNQQAQGLKNFLLPVESYLSQHG